MKTNSHIEVVANIIGSSMIVSSLILSIGVFWYGVFWLLKVGMLLVLGPGLATQ